MREITLKIDNNNDGRQIREVLKKFGVSSALLTKLKRTENGITKNGAFAKAIEPVHTGDIVKIKLLPSGRAPTPTKGSLDIVYEDEDIIVVNKPPYMPVHESRNHRGDTLSNLVAYHTGSNTAFRAVYRLDRDTSGLVLIAKHELAAAKLAGKIKKDYYALVSGTVTADGVVDKPIARCGDSIIRRRGDNNGERAVTRYFPIKQGENCTLLKFTLETGRTHQIRVHMEYIGHTLLGDSLYDGDCSKIGRQALHCKDIYFKHPVTGEEMHLSCDFPNDIKEVM